MTNINHDLNLIKKFLNFLEINGSSNNTIVSYQKDLKQFLEYICENKTINPEKDFGSKIGESFFFKSVCQNDFNEYTKKLYENHLTSSSLARKISCIRSFYKFIYYELRAIDSMPSVNFELPKLEKKMPKILSKNEINLITSFCLEKGSDVEQRNFLTWLLMHALLEFLYSTGCRITEALSIKIGEIINHLGCLSDDIIITGKGGSQRLILINEFAKNAILNFLKIKFHNKKNIIENFQNLRASGEFLFSLKEKGNALSRQRVFQLMQEAGSECGINPSKLSPHVIRHSIAIHLLAGNSNNNSSDAKNDLHETFTADIRLIQEFLGHKSINTTQIYLDYNNYQDLSNVVKSKHPLSNNELIEEAKISTKD